MEVGRKVLTLYNDIMATSIDWLWYPYIAIGKITLLQGDPGDGKSTMIMNLLASISNGYQLPNGAATQNPQRAIYQCSEDNAGDTIKPRLEAANANCRCIAFINEDVFGNITIDDEKLRQAIIEFHPRIVVIDPIQSYVDNPADLLVTGKLRKVLRKIELWAKTYDCAIVLVSHLNKNEGTKNLYRNLGSIDLVATARSVLQIEKDNDNPNHRIVHQIKNNIGPIGNDIHFEIDPQRGFRWLMDCEHEKVEEASQNNIVDNIPKTKQELAAVVLKKLLTNGAVESREIQHVLNQYGIGNKTMQNVKTALGIKSYRKMRKWYWVMPSADHDKARK